MTTVEKSLMYVALVPVLCIVHGLIGGAFVWLSFGYVYHLSPWPIRPLTYWEACWLCVLLRSLWPNVAVSTVRE